MRKEPEKGRENNFSPPGEAINGERGKWAVEVNAKGENKFKKSR